MFDGYVSLRPAAGAPPDSFTNKESAPMNRNTWLTTAAVSLLLGTAGAAQARHLDQADDASQLADSTASEQAAN
jgi:hypothetical protein